MPEGGLLTHTQKTGERWAWASSTKGHGGSALGFGHKSQWASHLPPLTALKGIAGPLGFRRRCISIQHGKWESRAQQGIVLDFKIKVYIKKLNSLASTLAPIAQTGGEVALRPAGAGVPGC